MAANTDDLLRRNGEHAGRHRSTTDKPTPAVAVVACMDSRVDVFSALGLEPGDAHVIRNAGGVVTEDVIRSLTISQRQLGSREVILMHHTDCGMTRFEEGQVKDAIEAETGVRPPFALRGFTDVEHSVRDSMSRLRASPFLAHRDRIRGFVYDVHTGGLSEVFELKSPTPPGRPMTGPQSPGGHGRAPRRQVD